MKGVNVVYESCVMKLDEWNSREEYTNSLRKMCALVIYKPLFSHYGRQSCVNVQLKDKIFPYKLDTLNIFGLYPMNYVINRLLFSMGRSDYFFHLKKHRENLVKCLESFRWTEYQLPEELDYSDDEESDNEGFYFEDDFSIDEGFVSNIKEYIDGSESYNKIKLK
jgi:hypothetical protein